MKQGKYAPVYLLHGDEPFFIDQITHWVEENALSPGERSFNQVVAYGKDVSVQDVLTHARRFPMMAQYQVVIIKEAQDITDLGRAEGRNKLESYLKQAVPSTIMVLAHKHKKLDGKTTLAKAFAASAVVVESTKVQDWKLSEWVTSLLKEKGLKYESSVPALVADYIGNDLSRINNEIDKLRLNLKDGQGMLTPDLVSEYIGISRDYNAFEFQKALIQRNAMKAYQIIAYFAKNPRAHDAIPIIALLFNYFSRVAMAHQQRDKSEGGIASALKIPPFQAKDVVSGVRAFNLARTLDIIHALRRADLKAKGVDSGSQETHADILRELVFVSLG